MTIDGFTVGTALVSVLLMDPVERTLRSDPVMARLIDRHGSIETEASENEYERLVVSIINQQLSTASANAVRERVFDVLEDVTPEAVLTAEEEALHEAGLSRTKVAYMQNAARAFQEQELGREGLANLTNEAVIEELTEITGVGEWTAQMYLLFVLNREDVLPLGDLGIRRGIEQLYGEGSEMSREEMRRVAEQWRPYRSIAVRYIWTEYESE